MAIKYVCDECGQEVYEPEAVGPGVFMFFDETPTMGKPYEFESDSSDLTLSVALKSRNGNHKHFCYACMWKTVKEMVLKYAPLTELNVGDGLHLGGNPTLAKVTDVITPSVDRANEMADEEMAHATEMRRAYEGPAKTLQIVDATGLPVSPFVVKRVDDENSDTGTGTDTELSELYSEGLLQETGSDECSDTPDAVARDDKAIPNFDDPVFPNRPGWRHTHLFPRDRD